MKLLPLAKKRPSDKYYSVSKIRPTREFDAKDKFYTVKKMKVLINGVPVIRTVYSFFMGGRFIKDD